MPQRKKAAPLPPRGTYKPPRTSWGDPDIAGAYNNSDETGIPFERPDEFAGRTLESFTPEELATITEQRQQQTIERNPTLSEFPGATSPMHWFENYFAANSRPWLVSDPPDGKVPRADRRSPAARRRRARPREPGAGPPIRTTDRSLYDRCITRGVPGSMMPAIYGNSYHIAQSPGVVTITYEMIHDTRVIPLDGTPHVGADDPPVLGRRARPLGRQHARRRDDELQRQGAVSRLERAPEAHRALHAARARHARVVRDVRRSAHLGAAVDVRDESRRTTSRSRSFEYACHEGNYGLANILSAARAEEARGKENNAASTAAINETGELQ